MAAGSSSDGEGYSRLSDGVDGSMNDPYEEFVHSQNVKDVFATFHDLCDSAGVEPFNSHGREFFADLKAGVQNWKAKGLWDIIEKRANRKEYDKGKACPDTKAFVIGAGPCGLRVAIELALLGAKVVLVEKRDSFTRHNVLYLWPYLMTDLANLGAKKFYGRLTAGSINHISIIKLQIILLKIALLLGVEIHHSVEFVGLDEKQKKDGWRAQVKPKDHRVSKYEFDVIIAADGRQGTLPGFESEESARSLAIGITSNFVNKGSKKEADTKEISGKSYIYNRKIFDGLKEKSIHPSFSSTGFEWKESARSLAIGITSNFVNKGSKRDADTKEISGKSYIYDQEFFDGLKERNIHLENIVYYKDETHYFVMTAKKQSLIEKGVIKQDETDTARLLASANVSEKKLQEFAIEAAQYATEGKLPTTEFAKNYRGKPDIAMFDFTSRKQATKAAIVREEDDGKRLIMAVVGDSCKEPFWPEGTGCALGFLGVFDTAWMIRTIANGDRTVEEALKNREVVYKLLSNTKQEDLKLDFQGYGIDPRTRYTSQVAQNRELYKPEPRREYVRRDSSSSDSPRNRTVSEYLEDDRKMHPNARPRLKSTPVFSGKSRSKNIREVDEEGLGEKRKRWSLKRGTSKEQKKEDKRTKDEKKNRGVKTKEDKGKKEKAEDKGKQKKKETKDGKEKGKGNVKKEKNIKENETKSSKKQKKAEKEKKRKGDKANKKKKDQKGKEHTGASEEVASGSPVVQKRGESIRNRIKDLESPNDVTKESRFKSLDRRDISFNDAKMKFSKPESPSSTGGSPHRSIPSTHEDETASQVEKQSFLGRLVFWKHRKNHGGDDVDGKKNKRKKLRLRKKIKRMRSRRKTTRAQKKQKKAAQRLASYQQLGSESPKSPAGSPVQVTAGSPSSHNNSPVGSRASSQEGSRTPPTSPAPGDEVDGLGGDGGQRYSKLSGSEEVFHQHQPKSERGGSFLKRIRSGKRKTSTKDYDRIQMETERPMGAK